jgi:hypothetical protein
MSSANLAVLGAPLPVIPNPTNIDKKIIGFDTEFLVSGKKRVDGDLQSAQSSDGEKTKFLLMVRTTEFLRQNVTALFTGLLHCVTLEVAFFDIPPLLIHP